MKEALRIKIKQELLKAAIDKNLLKSPDIPNDEASLDGKLGTMRYYFLIEKDGVTKYTDNFTEYSDDYVKESFKTSMFTHYLNSLPDDEVEAKKALANNVFVHAQFGDGFRFDENGAPVYVGDSVFKMSALDHPNIPKRAARMVGQFMEIDNALQKTEQELREMRGHPVKKPFFLFVHKWLGTKTYRNYNESTQKWENDVADKTTKISQMETKKQSIKGEYAKASTTYVDAVKPNTAAYNEYVKTKVSPLPDFDTALWMYQHPEQVPKEQEWFQKIQKEYTFPKAPKKGIPNDPSAHRPYNETPEQKKKFEDNLAKMNAELEQMTDPAQRTLRTMAIKAMENIRKRLLEQGRPKMETIEEMKILLMDQLVKSTINSMDVKILPRTDMLTFRSLKDDTKAVEDFVKKRNPGVIFNELVDEGILDKSNKKKPTVRSSAAQHMAEFIYDNAAEGMKDRYALLCSIKDEKSNPQNEQVQNSGNQIKNVENNMDLNKNVKVGP